jgi:NAD(P)-dependent dehydrogenase (short-subunit alcohol dehydrogenase family)/pimeloyl-ACP methyl ester carboxylesterase
VNVVSGGVRLAVQEHGDPTTPTILLVHGYPDTHAVWNDVVPLLSDNFHVVTYDVRGAGDSDRPRDQDAYHLEFLKRDLLAVVDAVSPDRPVHLVGHDWGSVQSWEAITEPGAGKRIASFTSISGPCLDHLGTWLRRPGTKQLRQLLRSWYVFAFQLPALAPLLWKLGLARRWGTLLRKREGVQQRPAPTLKGDAIRGTALYRANVLPRLKAPRDRRTDVPVQVVHPLHDRYVDTRPLPLHRWVTTLRRRVLASGHWAPLTHAPAVARMITEFIHDTTPKRELVVITGGGSGIGRATALAFAARGAVVVVSDVDVESAGETAAMTNGHAYQVDVSDERAVREWAREVAAVHGVPDVVVNNAGVGHSGSFLSTSTEQWRRVLDVNLWGVVNGCRAFGELMVEHGEGGHIVNLSSAAAYLPSKALSAYATSKAAVFMLSDCLRAELAPAGIGVSTICPGVVRTNITATTTFSGVDAVEQARKQARSTRLYALRGFGPEKVAEEVVHAVRTRRPVVPVTVEAKAARLLSRCAPSALRAFAKLNVI